jgi:hypothetical protein
MWSPSLSFHQSVVAQVTKSKKAKTVGMLVLWMLLHGITTQNLSMLIFSKLKPQSKMLKDPKKTNTRLIPMAISLF